MKKLKTSLSWLLLIIYMFSTVGAAPLPVHFVTERFQDSAASGMRLPEASLGTTNCSFKEVTFKMFLPVVHKGSAVVSQAVQAVPVPEDLLSQEPVSLPIPYAGSFAEETAFLYQGDQSIQSGVDQNVIDPLRSGVLRGRVCARDSQPIEGVQITILNHPEYGTTFSRADGIFDLVVNGGELLTVSYVKSGYLPIQRQIVAPVLDFAWLPEVALIPLDSQVTAIDLNAENPMQVAQGSQVSDRDGTRQATLLIPKDTQAQVVLPDGGTKAISTLHIRATEYTVGASGPAAMPAELPPSSGYTYALEYSIDEALAAGAVDVRFSQPLYHYVKNFLNFPVGMSVPVGYYDRQKAIWIPSENGRVVKIVNISGGLAEVDTDNDGAADNDASLGFTDVERSRLASLFPVGQSLWRVPITHFTPWDCNWPYGPPPGADGPNFKPSAYNPNDCPDCIERSIVEAQNQILGQSQPVIGTPFSMNYSSDRTPGLLTPFAIDIPLTGSSLPNQLKSIELEITVAGIRVSKQFPAAAMQSFRFVWDGRNAYGQKLSGKQPVTVRIGYTYPAVYYEPSDSERSFAEFSGIPITSNSARQEVTLWESWRGTIGSWDSRSLGLGGWTLSPVHAYDPRGKVLYQGDGSRTSASSYSAGVIQTVAGGGWLPGDPIGDGGPATQAELFWPSSIALIPGGGYDISDTGHHRIRWVSATGIINTIAGTGTGGYNGDNIPAVQAQLSNPEGIALGPDGSLYIADRSNQRIRRIGPDGIITTIAGTGAYGFSGDGGPATAAKLNEPYAVAVGPDGSVYFSDTRNQRIRAVSPDGIIRTVAGTGVGGALGDGGAARLAQVHEPRGLAFGQDGSLYIAAYYSHKVRRIGPDGIIETVAGTGDLGYNGDGIPATSAFLNGPMGVAVGPDDTLYIAEYSNQRVRHVGTDGVITTIAGTGAQGYSGDGGLATRAQLDSPDSVAVGSDGRIYIGDGYNHLVRQVAPSFPEISASNLFIPSENGNEVYIFTGSGRHLSTLNALTGATIYTFAYDSAFRLVSIIDAYGNTTSIQRDISGNPTAITSPYSQTTSLTVNANGYLTGLVDPGGRPLMLAYTDSGLLTSLTDGRGSVHQFQYDDLGRLTYDYDPAGDSLSITNSGGLHPTTVTLTTASGRTTTYTSAQNPDGSRQQTITHPGGSETVITVSPDGVRSVSTPDGSTIVTVSGPDPRWGMMSPLPAEKTITIPGGITSTKATSYSVVLSDPNNPFSLVSFDQTVTINGKVYTSRYTQSTRTLVDTSPEGRTKTRVLDIQGRLVSVQVGSYLPILYTYDSYGRLLRIEQGSAPEKRAVQMTYGTDGNVQSMTDPLGQVTSFSYDAAGQSVGEIAPGGGIVSYAYDANGNRTSITPPGKPSTAFSYTPVDLISAYSPPLVDTASGQVSYTYNTDRQVTTVAWADQTSTAMAYDAAGRLSTVTLGRGSVAYSYSLTGNPAGISAPGGITLSYTYDGPLLMTQSWTGALAGSVGFTYDNDLLQTATSVNGGNSILSQYDQDGLLSQAGAMAFVRDQIGMITGSTLGSLEETWTYNGFGESASYTGSFNNVPFYNAQYTRDVFGRVIQEIETIGGASDTYLYSYDQDGRLVAVNKNGATSASYTYDSNGNRLSATTGGNPTVASYDSQDRLIQNGSSSYTYSAAGQLTTKTNGSQVTTYQYDPLGNLVSAVLPGVGQITYLVDGENHRIGKKVNDNLVQGFLYQSDLRVAAELDGLGSLVSRFVYATHSNLPDYMINNGVIYRILADRSGSPRLVVNASTGQIVQRMDYDAFGNVIADSNPGFQPFGFGGGLYDRDLKLVRFGARDYDPETGRWTARDPILFGGQQLNLYTYDENDPINGADPNGLGPAEDQACVEFFGPPPAGQKKTNLACGSYNACINLPDPKKGDGEACKKCRELNEKWKVYLQHPDNGLDKGEKLKQECQRQDLDRICDSLCKVPCV